MPWMLSELTAFEALEFTVMLLLKRPGRWRGSKLTFTEPVCPGAIGWRLQDGVVQPQLARTLFRIRGASPVFLKTKS